MSESESADSPASTTTALVSIEGVPSVTSPSQTADELYEQVVAQSLADHDLEYDTIRCSLVESETGDLSQSEVKTGDFDRATTYETHGREAVWVYGPDHNPGEDDGSPSRAAVVVHDIKPGQRWVAIHVWSHTHESYQQLQVVAASEDFTSGRGTVDPRPELYRVAQTLMLAASDTNSPLDALQDAAETARRTAVSRGVGTHSDCETAPFDTLSEIVDHALAELHTGELDELENSLEALAAAVDESWCG
jgi:hypothetical protein